MNIYQIKTIDQETFLVEECFNVNHAIGKFLDKYCMKYEDDDIIEVKLLNQLNLN